MYHVGTVTAKIHTEFNVRDSAQCRLWKRYQNKSNGYELLTKTNQTVLEAGLYSRQVSEMEVVNFCTLLLLVSSITQLLMLEVKGDDDKWPIDKLVGSDSMDDSMKSKADSSQQRKIRVYLKLE